MMIAPRGLWLLRNAKRLIMQVAVNALDDPLLLEHAVLRFIIRATTGCHCSPVYFGFQSFLP